MSNIKSKNNVIIFTILIYSFIYFIFLNKITSSLPSIINLIFISLITIISYIIYGFKSCKINKKVLIEVILSILVYYLLIYILGIFTGYIKGSSLNISLFSLIILEILRYILITPNKESKEYIVYITISLILIDIVLNSYVLENTYNAIFTFITVTIIPIIFKNIVLTYITYNVGYLETLTYIILISISYLLPYIPNLGNYLYSVLNISLLTIIYIYTNKILSNKINIKKEIIKTIICLPLIIILFIIICLTSSKFKYSLLSLNIDGYKTIEKGDLVLVKKIEFDEYKIGDIVIYNNEGNISIGEVTNIELSKLYVTNEEEIVVTKEDIIGRYENKRLAKLGYPSIWLDNLMK